MITDANVRAFDAIGALVVVLDVDARVVHWNAACTELTGQPLDEFRGQPLWDLLPRPADRVTAKQTFAKLLAGERSAGFATWWVTKSGEELWIAWSTTVGESEDHARRYFVCTGIDRTERKRAEDALRGSEAKLDGIIRLATDAIISVDADRRIVMYNVGAEHIFGWSAAEIIGKSLATLMATPSGDGEANASIVAQRKNGEEFPARAASSKMMTEDGALFTIILRDVSEQRDQERRQEILARHGSALLGAVTDVDAALGCTTRLAVEDLADFCVVDLDQTDRWPHRIKATHRDPAFDTMCAALNQPQLGNCGEDSRTKLERPRLILDASSEHLETLVRSERQRAALRELVPRSIIAVPLRAVELRGTILLISTSRRFKGGDLVLAEEFAHRAALTIENARLQGDVRRYMDDVREANENLVMATIRAEELNEATEAALAHVAESERGLRALATENALLLEEARSAIAARERVLGIVAHDLRNPLAVLSLQADALTRGGDEMDRRAPEPAVRMRRTVARMARLVQNLLDVSQLEAGGWSLRCAPIVAAQLVEDALAAQQVLAIPAALDIVTEIDPDLPELVGDRDQLLRVFENLVSNAIKFTKGGGRIALGASLMPNEVVSHVSDTGAGIAPGNIPHLFEQFWQAARADRRGAGLGLGIARGIVLAHGGRFWVESAVGVGSTFFFTLPIPTATDADVDRSARADVHGVQPR